MNSLLQRTLHLLSRRTSGLSFIPEIDGLRFLALLPVIFYHLWGNFSTYAQGHFLIPSLTAAPVAILGVDDGKMGVKLFFIISGVILGLPFARQYVAGGKKVALGKYFKRRLVRLEPPYILNLLFAFSLLLLLKGDFPLRQGIEHLLASIFYLHNLLYAQQSLINAVAWSLEIEVQFYILVPLLSLIFALHAPLTRRLLLVVAIISSSVFSYVVSDSAHISLSVLSYLQYFLVGFLVVEWLLSQPAEKKRPSYAFDLVMVICVVLFFSLGLLLDYAGLLTPWFGLLMVISTFRGVLTAQFFKKEVIYTIGGMCYTIYLYHFFIIGILGHGRLFFFETFWLNFILTFTVVPLAVLIVSSVVFVLFEKPFMGDWQSHVSRLFSRRR